MILKLIDEEIEGDQLFGPMPDFDNSFEQFFIQKAACSLYSTQQVKQIKANIYFSVDEEEEVDEENKDKIVENSTEFKFISLKNSNDLAWMHEIELAKNCREQNLEIIYNDNRVYFKTTKKIYHSQVLAAFPSKDLEISLGLQFIPFKNDDNFSCRKCLKNLFFQNHLMLHNRYFCSQTTNNLLRQLSEDGFESVSIQSVKKPHFKRKSHYSANNVKKKMSPNKETVELNAHFNSQNECFKNNNNEMKSKYFQNFLCNFLSSPSSLNPVDLTTTSNYFKTNNNADQTETLKYVYSFFEKVQNFNKVENLSHLNYFDFFNSFQTALNNFHAQTSSKHEVHFDYRVNAVNRINTPSQTSEPPATTSLMLNPAGVVQPVVAKSNLNEIISAQSGQNWCAICNTHFRLTSDLVYHMRTLHRKEENQVASRLSKLSFELAKVVPATVSNKEAAVNGRDMKYLKCEICHELFKEKHHLSRHMTSHR